MEIIPLQRTHMRSLLLWLLLAVITCGDPSKVFKVSDIFKEVVTPLLTF